jgi:quercetin dioxygenase-like cupin family protein
MWSHHEGWTLESTRVATIQQVEAGRGRDRLKLWDLRYVPGRPLPRHFHERDSVVIVLGEGEVLTRTSSGEPTVTRWTFGDVHWAEGGEAHSEEAIAGAPWAYVVELK